MVFLYKNKKVCFHLHEKGEKSNLVLIHGFCEDQKIWTHLIPNLNANILTLDLPGFGKSETINSSISEIAEIVVHITDEINFNRFYILGHSMGGYVCMEFLSRFPKKLTGMCILNSHPFADDSEKINGRKRSIQFIQKHGTTSFVKEVITGLFYDTKKHKTDINMLITRAKKFKPEGIIQALKMMIERQDHRKTLSSCTIPVLFLLGSEDKLLEYNKMVSQTYLPSISDIHILPYVGHMIQYEASEKMIAVLNRFLSGCDFRDSI